MHGYIVGGVYIKKEKEDSKLMLGGGCWTVNLDEINSSRDLIKSIRYETEKDVYTIDIDNAFKHGFIKNFVGENKLCVPLKFWEDTLTQNIIPDKKGKEMPVSYEQGKLFIKEALNIINKSRENQCQ